MFVEYTMCIYKSMNRTKKISPEDKISMIKRAIEKKKAIDLFFRGKLSFKEVNAYGIKSALPL